jgi:hypothetical protein
VERSDANLPVRQLRVSIGEGNDALWVFAGVLAMDLI